MNLKKFLKSILILFLMFGIYCYGSFPLVRAVYKFNGSIGDNSKAGGVVRSLVMILLTIIPVYGISFLADVIILNSIEFWSGNRVNFQKVPQNPILDLYQTNDQLIIFDKKNQNHFYLFRNQPGKIFIQKNGSYQLVEFELKDNILILKDKESIILEKKLTDEEISYIF